MKARNFAPFAFVALLAVGCSGGEGEAADTPTATATTEVNEKPSPSPSTTPTPSEPEVITYQLGEAVETPSASITIHAAESVDAIETGSEYVPLIGPAEGGTAWKLSMNWTNLTNEAVGKVCWGPNMVNMRVYDTRDREMLLDDRSGSIPGNDCTNGLMTGQSGDWYAVYQGLGDAEIAYAIVEDYANIGGRPVAVALKPGLELGLS